MLFNLFWRQDKIIVGVNESEGLRPVKLRDSKPSSSITLPTLLNILKQGCRLKPWSLKSTKGGNGNKGRCELTSGVAGY